MSRAPSCPCSTSAGRVVMASSGKVHRPRLANEHDLDLARVLQLGLDAARDLLRERRHATVVHVVGNHHDTDLATGLDGEDALHTLVAGRDTLEPFETLDV